MNELLHLLNDIAREYSPTCSYKLAIEYDSKAEKCCVAITFPALVEGVFLESEAKDKIIYVALKDAVALLVGKIEMKKRGFQY